MAYNQNYDYYPPGNQGAPPPPPPPPGQQAAWDEPPAPRPSTAAPGRPPSGDMMRPKPAAIIAVIGVLLFFVGVIIVQSTTLMKPPEMPDSNDFDDFDKYLDAVKDYEKDSEDYKDKIRNTFGIGRILGWTGAMIIAIPLYIVGVANEKLDWKVRASMLTAATTIVVATMIMSTFAMLGPL